MRWLAIAAGAVAALVVLAVRHGVRRDGTSLIPAANLTPAGAVGGWTEAQFVRAMREGRRPDGTAIDQFMPWRVYRHMTDDELRALWLHLRSAPAREFGHK